MTHNIQYVTENQWFECRVPSSMLMQLRLMRNLRKKNERNRLRKFACECARRVQRMMTPRGRRGLELGEGLAEGAKVVFSRADARRAKQRPLAGSRKLEQIADEAAWATAGSDILVAAYDTAQSAASAIYAEAEKLRSDAYTAAMTERQMQCQFLIDIFGNPFRPASINPAWLAWNRGTVVKLATTIYEDRRWDLMPILGDALEDALCDNTDILEHCRGPGPHVRGCWVVDLILGKE